MWVIAIEFTGLTAETALYQPRQLLHRLRLYCRESPFSPVHPHVLTLLCFCQPSGEGKGRFRFGTSADPANQSVHDHIQRAGERDRKRYTGRAV